MNCSRRRNPNPTVTYEHKGFVRRSPLLLRRMSLSAYFPREIDEPNAVALPSEFESQVMNGCGSGGVGDFDSHPLGKGKPLSFQETGSSVTRKDHPLGCVLDPQSPIGVVATCTILDSDNLLWSCS